MDFKNTVSCSRIIRWIFLAVLIVFIVVLNYCSLSEHMASNNSYITDYALPEDYEERNREPVVAGLFYPQDEKILSHDLDTYLTANEDKLPDVSPKLLIVPHAGYQYSAQVAAKAYLSLRPFAAKIKNVILVGPSHYVPVPGAALSGADNFSTPLGKIKINRNINDELLKNKNFNIRDNAHAKEHSLEVQLPFLQKILPDFEIVPIVYGAISPESMAAALEPYLSRTDTIIIFSADLSHYYEYDIAKQLDSETAELIKNRNASVSEHLSCGATAINTALVLAERYNFMPDMLDLTNSGDIAKQFDRVVGYGAWQFLPDENKEQSNVLSEDMDSLNNFKKVYGEDLMNVAVETLNRAVFDKSKYVPSRKDYADPLFNKGAAFVTLNKDGKLRGCMGSVVPTQGIARNIAENAYAAAMEDSRFTPLQPDELAETSVTISLLTGFEPIIYKNEADLLTKLVPGTDGVVIRSGSRQAVFLPSVWKEIPDKQEFLNNLKFKAGMNPSYWSNKIKVYRFYTVEINQNAD